MQYLLNSYVMSFNRKYERKGHLFEERFRAESIGDEGLVLPLTRYVHLNPVMAELVADPKDWQWSSYRDYTGTRNGTLCNIELGLSSFSVNEYIKYCQSDIERSRLVRDQKQLGKLMEKKVASISR